MTEKIFRNYLEIKSHKDLKEVKKPSDNYSVELVDPKDFQLNKFFYKNIGKKYKWIDRLVWTESKWIEYVSNKNIKTYILKKKPAQGPDTSSPTHPVIMPLSTSHPPS